MAIRRTLLLGLLALAGCAEPRPQAPAASPLGVDLGASSRVAAVPGQVGEGEFAGTPQPVIVAPVKASPAPPSPPAAPSSPAAPVDHSKMHHDHAGMSHD